MIINLSLLTLELLTRTTQNYRKRTFKYENVWNKNVTFRDNLKLFWSNHGNDNSNFFRICSDLATRILHWPLKDLKEVNDNINKLTRVLEALMINCT